MGIPGVQAPTRLGRYELMARLATGGMGEIFLARLEGAEGFEKLFVVKRILPHLADDARFRQMLIAEARLASKLSHANICQVYELGETDGQLYIVMEYLEGITVLPLLRRASKETTLLDFGFVAGVIQQTCDALNYAHELNDRGGEPLGIVHRDVTPSNVFLTDTGVVKVLDFGIAKVKNASANTQTGTVKGKYAYMAPEQLRGVDLDKRADVFALGVVLYEMIALRRLFQRKTDYLTFRAVMEQPIPDIRRYRPDVPEALVFLLARALDRDPANRPDSARQFGTAVLDAIAPVRGWTQGEIGDFVRANFAEEIKQRSAQVATAVNRTHAGKRSTMPLVAAEESIDTPIDDDDDDGFPSVDSTMSAAPLDAREGRPPLPGTDFAGGTAHQTPLPFGADPSTSGPALRPIRPGMTLPQSALAQLQTEQIPKQGRSLVWPMLAIAMVVIAGGALFLVWKQTQQQPQQQVIITSSDDGRGGSRTTPTTPTVEGPGAATGSGSASTKPIDEVPDPPPGKGSAVKPAIRPPVAKGDPYTEQLRARRPQISKCGAEHGAPPAGAKIVIVVGVDGRAKTITLEPQGLESTPLGACIKNVLGDVRFPKSPDEKQVAVPLKTS